MQDLTCSEHQIVHAYKVSGRDCRISRLKNSSYMPARYQEGAAGSHGFGTTDPTCLRGIRIGLEDLTCSEHQIAHAYKVSGRDCRISRLRKSDRSCLQGIRMVLQDLTGLEQQIHPAYAVSGWGCRISGVGNTRSYIPT